MRNAIGRSALGLGVVGILMLAATESRAQTTGGSSSANQCGSTSAGWNVPSGDAVFVSGPGPVYATLAAMGEYRSHSMLSRGPDGYVTHATSVSPPTNGDTSPYWTPFCSSCGSECWNPINTSFLQNAMPGLEMVQQGAIYSFLYGSGSSESFIAYQSGSQGSGTSTAANQATLGGYWLSPNMAWNGWFSSDSTQGNQQTSTVYTAWFNIEYNKTPIHYGWFQYMNTQGTPGGVPGVNNGVVCSSSLALWQHDALSGNPNGTGYSGDVIPRTYAKGGALTNAANALWNGVQNECSSTTGWFSSLGSFFTNLGWTGLCLGATGLTQGVCGQAADQMVNCFAANNCGNGSSPGSYWGSYTSHNNGTTQWQAATSNNNSVAISPDDVACWNGNGTGAPCSGNGSSIWGWDGNETVQWNSGGNQYGCWD